MIFCILVTEVALVPLSAERRRGAEEVNHAFIHLLKGVFFHFDIS